MPRVIWKGAISFGLLHVPVAVYPASEDSGIDFDWLDKRTMDPVGYSRINKRTGKAIDKAYVVKGVKVEDGSYAVVDDDEIKAAYPEATQTIAIETFVSASEVAFTYLEHPYYLSPLGKSDKVYALLREALREQKVIGVARVVMRSKERLALLLPLGPALVLNIIRWGADIRPMDDLHLPPEGKNAAGVKDTERAMAGQLIADMTHSWEPAAYRDTFSDAIRALVAGKVKRGDTAVSQPVGAASATPVTSNVVDLTALLRQSLVARKKESLPEEPTGRGKRPKTKKIA